MKEQVNISFFHIKAQEMKMDKSKPRYGVIWPGLKGRYISAQGNALGSLYFSIQPCKGMTFNQNCI